MQSLNILITNYCNEKCDFCFARQEMKRQLIPREMTLIDYGKILQKLKNKNVDTVKLLGGEPTLHTNFEQIINLTLEKFPFIQIFTNGIFNDNKSKFLEKFFPRIKLTFNLMTPSFQFNPQIRELLIKRIISYASRTEITLSLTIDPTSNIDFILNIVSEKVVKNVNSIRIGLSNPIVGKKNFYSFDQFPTIGIRVYELIKKIKHLNQLARINLNCGFTRCMFTDQQYDYLIKNDLDSTRWSCFGKNSSMDVQTNLSSFHCFPLSVKDRLSIKGISLNKANSAFLKKRFEYWSKIYLDICRKCPFYGHIPNKCPGPCIAFCTNLENAVNSTILFLN